MYANSGFAAGLLVPFLLNRLRAPKLWLALFIASFFYCYWYPDPSPRMWAGIGSAALVLAAVQSELRLPRFIDATLGRWGDWSYGLYLIHVPVTRSILFYAAPALPISVVFPAVIAAVLAAGAALGALDLALHERSRIATAAMPRALKVAVGIGFAAAYVAAGVWFAM